MRYGVLLGVSERWSRCGEIMFTRGGNGWNPGGPTCALEEFTQVGVAVSLRRHDIEDRQSNARWRQKSLCSKEERS